MTKVGSVWSSARLAIDRRDRTVLSSNSKGTFYHNTEMSTMTDSGRIRLNIDMASANSPSHSASSQSYASSSLGPESYLEKYGEVYSSKHLRMLLDTARATPDNLASFVGAGVSEPLGSMD